MKVINAYMSEYLEVGKVYHVFGVRISHECTYYMLFLNERHLIEVPYSLFEIVGGRVPSIWEARQDENGISFWPAMFYEDDFLEKFSDWGEKERLDFVDLKILIESA